MKEKNSTLALPDQANAEQYKRFRGAILQALALKDYSQRELGERLGVTIGTMTKYLRQVVHPFKVGLGIQRSLARELGVSLDALVTYYESGEYQTGLTLNDVEGWIRSSAGQGDLPAIMKSMHEAALRAVEAETSGEPPRPVYDWPIEELRRVQVSDAMRERLGLTDEALRQLAVEGVFDGEMVEAFALVTGRAKDAVHQAFTRQEPLQA